MVLISSSSTVSITLLFTVNLYPCLLNLHLSLLEILFHFTSFLRDISLMFFIQVAFLEFIFVRGKGIR